MTIQELPKEIQEQLAQERAQLSGKQINTAYEVKLYNADGTRYFSARRCCQSWNDDKGHAMPFGGGTYWRVRYGSVQFRAYKDLFGGRCYELCDGKTFSRSANGTVIPSRIETKKEVMSLIKSIGIFSINK